MTGNTSEIRTDAEIDADALRTKYREERDKRLRSDGENQFVELSGKYSRYFEVDPYVERGLKRAPLLDEMEVAVIGGGFAGLLASARLREAGLNDLRVIEAAADFGGVWYWNRYPGAQCDVESYCYLPLLEETNYIPKEKFSYAPEIFRHAQRIAQKYDLYRNACLQTRVQELRWDETAQRWIIRTNHQDAMKARFVVLTTGPASQPRLPGIPGLDDFAGHTFHTSRWDYDYTGGDHGGELHKLHDKRVAVIGTGATGIQCVPHVARGAQHLYVFQRTPSTVSERGNRPTDPEWARSLKPGWQLQRQENFEDVVNGRPVEVDLVDDGLTRIHRTLQSLIPLGDHSGASMEEMMRLAELADFKKMNEIRARVDATVKDRKVAEILKPWYRLFCKRPTFSDDYLATFNRPNVTLVDTSACKGVQRITPTGVVANDVHHEVDCIIFATGFEISSSYKRRIGFEIYGVGGKTLSSHWSTGMRTLHGHSAHGFPNWFFVGPAQSAISFNFSATVGEQARQVAYIINETRSRAARSVQPTPEAEEAWAGRLREVAIKNDAFYESCTPGYYNNEGHFRESNNKLFSNIYTPGIKAFNALLAQWRSRGDLQGMHFG